MGIIYILGASLALLISTTSSLPLVDPGVFVIQGVSSCLNGTGYCLLGPACQIDKDFISDDTGGHCNGLINAFTPKASFVCCKYNPMAKMTSEFPTTTLQSFTITDIFDVIDELPYHEYEEEGEVPENVDPSSLIDIVGVVTDRTAVLSLITRPWTGTIPTRPTTTPMPSPQSTIPTTVAPISPATTAEPDSMDLLPETTTEREITEITENYNESPTETTESHASDNLTKEPSFTQISTDLETMTSLENNKIDFATTPTTRKSSSPSSKPANSQNFETLPPLEKPKVSVSATVDFKLSTPLKRPDDANSAIILLTDTGNYIETIDRISDEDLLKLESRQSPHNFDLNSKNDSNLLLNSTCGIKGSTQSNSGIQLIPGTGDYDLSLAYTTEWCWVVTIVEFRNSKFKYLCTGALVEEDVVLTTATCVQRLQRSMSSYKVVLGLNDYKNLSVDSPQRTQIMDIYDIDFHPSFKTAGGASVNDVGFIILKKPVDLHDSSFCTICLDNAFDNIQNLDDKKEKCTAVGFSIEVFSLGDSSDGHLRHLDISIESKSECEDKLKMAGYSTKSFESASLLCTMESASWLQGVSCRPAIDRGSPLACEINGRWFLKGLKSWSESCRTRIIKDIYTDITYFTPWIDRILTFWKQKQQVLQEETRETTRWRLN